MQMADDSAKRRLEGFPTCVWFRSEDAADAVAREYLAPAGREYRTRRVSLEEFRRDYRDLAGSYLHMDVETALRWELGLREGQALGLAGEPLRAYRVAVLREGHAEPTTDPRPPRRAA
jgi:hypothetical protein